MKICPLLTIGRTSGTAACIGHSCALWCKHSFEERGCALFELNENLAKVAEVLSEEQE